MKILIDSNVLISALLSPKGTSALAFIKALDIQNEAMVCEQNIEELCRFFRQKMPAKENVLNNFLLDLYKNLEIVCVPEEVLSTELKIRDADDRPILRAAVVAGADIILTGDRDFLESGINKPLILTPA